MYNKNQEQGMWAIMRRGVYAVVAVAQFSIGVLSLKDTPPLPPLFATAIMVLLLAIAFFPMVRWLGLIDQDRWVGWRARRRT
jgi:hypothetical protein